MSQPKWVSELKWPESEARPLRLAASKEEFKIRGMFFTSTVETVRRLIDPTAAEEVLKRAEADEEYSPLRSYSLRRFMQLQLIAATRIEKLTGSLEEAVAKTGSAAVEIFFESVAGRTMRLLAGKEPHRLLGAAPNGYSLAVSDQGKRDYKKTSDKSGVFTFRDDILGPCHQIGVFVAAVKSACDVDVEIHVEPGVKPTDFELQVSW